MAQITKINGVPIANTSVSALTYGNNTFTVSNTDGTSQSATINTMTGLTVNGIIGITSVPANNDANTQILSRNSSTGNIEYINSSAVTGTFNYGLTYSLATGNYLI